MSDLDSAAPSTRRRAKAKPYTNGTTDPSQQLLHALQAMRSGDFSELLQPGNRWYPGDKTPRAIGRPGDPSAGSLTVLQHEDGR